MSYKSLSTLSKEISSQLERLENEELSVNDLHEIQANARDLYERITILKYQAIEKVVKPVAETASIIEETQPVIEEELPNQPPTNKGSLKFDIAADEEDTPQNQTNLLDEIKERVEEASSLKDKLNTDGSGKSLAEKLKMQPISDLKTAIGMNEKFLFMNDLFQGERDAFHQSLDYLNSLSTFLEADDYINNNLVAKYSWDLESISAVRFMELVERRYLG